MTCMVNERQCRSVDGNLVGESCATCAGLTAAPGKKNMVRRCVWYDPEAGIHCFADAKPSGKRELWRKVADKSHAKRKTESESDDDASTTPAEANSTVAEANKIRAQDSGDQSCTPPETTTVMPESVLEIMGYEIVLLSLVLAVGGGAINTDEHRNMELLYSETAKSLGECTTVKDEGPYLEYINRMNWLMHQGHGLSYAFMRKWLQNAEALLS